MQGLILSMVRFSAAVTLYSLEQLQSTLYVTRGGQDFFKALDKMEIAFNSLAEDLVRKLDSGKKDTLQKVTSMAEGVVSRSLQGMNMMDPREALRMTDQWIQKSSGSFSSWIGNSSGEGQDRPRRAADVLGS